MQFVDDLPPAKGDRRSAAVDISLLRAEPGRWAEVARYPKDRRPTAASRGSQFASRHPDVEYATRAVGDEVVLYLRAVSA